MAVRLARSAGLFTRRTAIRSLDTRQAYSTHLVDNFDPETIINECGALRASIQSINDVCSWFLAMIFII